METLKTKSIQKIEARMEGVSEDSIRYQILQSAKAFKTSWVALGQALYAVWKDKLYKEWGYMTFEAYTAKEIGIKKPTAMKLLKSYYFLEKEEPAYLKQGVEKTEEVAMLPSYESVNLLRLAKNKDTVDKDDYAKLKKATFEMGKDARDIKKDLTSIIKQREELEPEEAREKKRLAGVRRLLSVLKTLKKEIEVSKMLPAGTLKEITVLIAKIEAEIN